MTMSRTRQSGASIKFMLCGIGCAAVVALSALLALGCADVSEAGDVKPGQRLERRGDEIVVCGQYFHTGAPVVLWTDPGGYDAYRTERRFVPWEKASFAATAQESVYVRSPARYNVRFAPTTRPTTGPATGPTMREDLRGTLTAEEFEMVRGGGWPLELLQEKVDQFVYHYDVCGTSRTCFKVLHDMRGLSVHFMLDLDGTIYQTLDLKERAWHATTSNSQSIGIEIANMGAYTNPARSPLREWYGKDDEGRTVITIPSRFGDGGIRTKDFIGRPAREELVWGEVQGRRYAMYDLTPQQYDSLIRLTAALCTVFPKMKCDYPRDEEGKLITRKLADDVLEEYQGLMAHYHVQRDKQDPGPAFQWDKVVDGARALMER
jgi:N-acetyl-anhydromuramyl-L-alanine amidase AmpD